jgi:hypothetical protein
MHIFSHDKSPRFCSCRATCQVLAFPGASTLLGDSDLSTSLRPAASSQLASASRQHRLTCPIPFGFRSDQSCRFLPFSFDLSPLPHPSPGRLLTSCPFGSLSFRVDYSRQLTFSPIRCDYSNPLNCVLPVHIRLPIAISSLVSATPTTRLISFLGSSNRLSL